MSFNEDKPQPQVAPTHPTCKDCKAFVPIEYPRGLCVLNPPQVCLQGDEVYSASPEVDGDKSYCLKLQKKI